MHLKKYCAALAVVLPALCLPLHSQAAALYTVHVLPDGFAPSAINNAGQMAGSVLATDGSLHAAMYGGGAVTDLGTFGGTYSFANAINAAGAIVGNFGAAAGDGHAFIYDHGSMVAIDNAYGMGINAHGDMVGQRYTGTGYTGFLYSQGTLTELGHLGKGDTSLAASINDGGQIVGESNIDVELHAPFHPFLYSSGALLDLGTLAGREINSAAVINNAGQIAGTSEGDNGGMHAFFYERGLMTDLGFFGGLNLSIGGMNQHGQVVGTGQSFDGPDVAFISLGGTLLDLNTMIDRALGWTITGALGINDLGQVIANACRDDFTCSAVRLDLASAVPEPAGVLMLLVGLTGAAAWRRARVRRSRTAAPLFA